MIIWTSTGKWGLLKFLALIGKVARVIMLMMQVPRKLSVKTYQNWFKVSKTDLTKQTMLDHNRTVHKTNLALCKPVAASDWRKDILVQFMGWYTQVGQDILFKTGWKKNLSRTQVLRSSQQLEKQAAAPYLFRGLYPCLSLTGTQETTTL